MNIINTVPWNVVYGVVAVSTIVCNVFVLFVFFKSDRLRRMRTTLFLIGLAVADLIVGAVGIPMYMAILWPGSEVANRRAFILSYYLIEIVSSFASLFLLAVIALERVYSILWPYRHRALRKTPYYLALFTSWLLAVLQMTLFSVKWYDLINSKEYFCTMFPSMMAVVITIIVSYFAIWKKIKKSRMDGLPQRRDEHERKLAKTLAILTGIFLITWLPFSAVNAFYLLSSINGPVWPWSAPFWNEVLPQLVCASKLLHYSNSLANPVVYSFRFPEVRRTLGKVFCGREQVVAPADLRLAVRRGEGGRQ